MELQRQIAYDRPLERLYLADEGWVVKGATALLARDLGMRATIDVDVYRGADRGGRRGGPPTGCPTGHRRLVPVRDRSGTDHRRGRDRRAPSGDGTRRHDAVGGMSCRPGLAPISAWLATLSRFPPLARIVMPDLEQHGYRAYPLADHVADKAVATFQRYGPRRLPSTRYKDLVDLGTAE